MISYNKIIVYIIILNILGYLIMYIDKRRAKKQQWRIWEQTIFLITFLGGGIGTTLGMYTFRHKTKKIKFIIGLPLITIIEIVVIIYINVI